MKNVSLRSNTGFTLIELVTVIVLMGVLAVGISSFLKFGSQLYAETSVRDRLISSARFAVERLNREVRHALPNSMRVNGQCLYFTPIVASTIYTDIPVSPEPARNEISVIRFSQEDAITGLRAVVYPLNADDAADGSEKVFTITSIDTAVMPRVITLGAVNIHFEQDSPSERVFFIDQEVSYCVNSNNELIREQDGALATMAENISNPDPFQVSDATLQRNAVVHIKLTFEYNQKTETVTFNNEIQVPNVP